jgi:hypothetical protein
MKDENCLAFLGQSQDGQMYLRLGVHIGWHQDAYGAFPFDEPVKLEGYVPIDINSPSLLIGENGAYWGIRGDTRQITRFYAKKFYFGGETSPGYSVEVPEPGSTLYLHKIKHIATGHLEETTYDIHAVSWDGNVVGGVARDKSTGEPYVFRCSPKQCTTFCLPKGSKHVKVQEISPDGKKMLGCFYTEDQKLQPFYACDDTLGDFRVLEPFSNKSKATALMDSCFLSNGMIGYCVRLAHFKDEKTPQATVKTPEEEKSQFGLCCYAPEKARLRQCQPVKGAGSQQVPERCVTCVPFFDREDLHGDEIIHIMSDPGEHRPLLVLKVPDTDGKFRLYVLLSNQTQWLTLEEFLQEEHGFHLQRDLTAHYEAVIFSTIGLDLRLPSEKFFNHLEEASYEADLAFYNASGRAIKASTTLNVLEDYKVKQKEILDRQSSEIEIAKKDKSSPGCGEKLAGLAKQCAESKVALKKIEERILSQEKECEESYKTLQLSQDRKFYIDALKDYLQKGSPKPSSLEILGYDISRDGNEILVRAKYGPFECLFSLLLGKSNVYGVAHHAFRGRGSIEVRPRKVLGKGFFENLLREEESSFPNTAPQGSKTEPLKKKDRRK